MALSNIALTIISISIAVLVCLGIFAGSAWLRSFIKRRQSARNLLGHNMTHSNQDEAIPLNALNQRQPNSRGGQNSLFDARPIQVDADHLAIPNPQFTARPDDAVHAAIRMQPLVHPGNRQQRQPRRYPPAFLNWIPNASLLRTHSAAAATSPQFRTNGADRPQAPASAWHSKHDSAAMPRDLPHV